MFDGVGKQMSPCNSIVVLYFKGTCDIISIIMAIHKVHQKKRPIKFIFVTYRDRAEGGAGGGAIAPYFFCKNKNKLNKK